MTAPLSNREKFRLKRNCDESKKFIIDDEDDVSDADHKEALKKEENRKWAEDEYWRLCRANQKLPGLDAADIIKRNMLKKFLEKRGIWTGDK